MAAKDWASHKTNDGRDYEYNATNGKFRWVDETGAKKTSTQPPNWIGTAAQSRTPITDPTAKAAWDKAHSNGAGGSSTSVTNNTKPVVTVDSFGVKHYDKPPNNGGLEGGQILDPKTGKGVDVSAPPPTTTAKPPADPDGGRNYDSTAPENAGTTTSAPSVLPSDVNELLNRNIQIGNDWLQFSNQQFKATTEQLHSLNTMIDDWSAQAKTLTTDQLALTKRLNDQSIATKEKVNTALQTQSDQILQQSQADRQRYDTTFRPLEDQFVADAKAYDSPERQAEAAAKAKAGVFTAAADARAAAERQAGALGLRPDSGRYAGIERSTDMATSLASVGAQDAAREAVRDKGLALRTTAIGLGQNLPGQAQQEAALAINGQNQILNNETAVNNSVLSSTADANAAAMGTGAVAAGLKQGNVNLGLSAAGLRGSGYNAVVSANGAKAGASMGKIQDDAAAEAANTQGIWDAIGTGAGLLLGGTKPWILSDENLKEDKAPIPDGQALDAVENMPVEQWRYKDGVADGGQHVGTYAQDFQEQTGRGDGTGIPVQDAIGVTMKAVQDLSAKVDRIASAVGIADPRKQPMKKPAMGMKRAA